MDRGYDPCRFIERVRRDLLCCICECVLKEPRLCEAGEHYFCYNCITQSLAHSATCPVCRQPLTLETLKHPQSFLRIILSEQRIRCDYIDRGCSEHVQLGTLQSHLNICEYRPVTCESCGRKVNAKNKDNHEKILCELGGADIQEFGDIQMRQEEFNQEQSKILDCKVHQDQMGKDFQQKLQSDEPVKVTNGDKGSHNSYMYGIFKSEITGIKRRQDDESVKVTRIKKGFDVERQTQSGINKNVNGMNDKVNFLEENVVVMKQQSERMLKLMNQLLPQDVIILGGCYGVRRGNTLYSVKVEKYNVLEKESTVLSRLNHYQMSPASCVYNGDILLVGGFGNEGGTNEIKALKMNQRPLRWKVLKRILAKLFAHDVVVDEDEGKLYIIGGHDCNEKETSNVIYEIALTPPYTAKLLTTMTEPREYHRAELVNGKLFILGGTTTGLSKDGVDSVVVYDSVKNEFKPCPSLPQPVSRMSTVTWGNMIIVVGGQDKNGQVLNDVIMYDTETGHTERLPPMKYRRCGCSAVIMNDVIVVFGGLNEEQGYLNSVESFTIGGYSWKKLPGMIEGRCWATAVVKPHN